MPSGPSLYVMWAKVHAYSIQVDSNCMQMQSLEGTPACLDSRPELPLVEELISSLKKCREKKDLLCADHVHKSIHSHGLESYSVLGNYLVPVFVECGSVMGAQQVFNKLVHRNEHSWTSLIQGHIECGQFKHALNMFEKMQDDCVRPSKFTLQAVLKACSRLKYMNGAREVHIEITKEGLETDPFVGNSLVDVYAKCGSLADARAMTCKLLARNEALWSTLITVYADHGLLDEVLNCLHEMQLDGVAPDAVMLVHALKACGGTGAIGKGQELHAEIAQQGLESDLFVGNTLVDMYVKSGSLVEAQSILDKLPVRDVVSWTALIAGYAEHGLGDEVLNCLEQMRLEGISPNDVTYVCSLKGCGSIGAIHRGQELHAEIATEGFENHSSVGTSVMDMYTKCGSLVEAWQVFEELSARDVVSWNVVIAGYAAHGHGEEALKCLALMQKDGVTTNAVTFSSALKGCCSMGWLERGMEVHSEIAIEGFETDPFVGCTLVDMYAKCGSLTEAQDVFDELPVQNVVAWTALIAGYAEHGLGLEAVKCLKQMQMDCVFPNDATFVCTLKGCSILEAMEKGQEVHTEIIKEGLERLPHIGSTLIDMYAKCGSLAEAQDVFDDLPVVDAVSWNALMAGHAEHGVREEVLNLFKKMQLEGVSPDAGTYVCSLKVCGSIGAIDKGQDLHMEIIKEGFEAGPFVGNTLVDMYAKCGSLAEAHEVFEELPIHDVVSWNALIAGYAEHKLSEEALHCLEQMQHEGVRADAVSFVCSLKACSSTGATGRGQEIHAELVKMGLEDDSSVCNTLVDIYAKWGFLAEAQEVFDHMSFRDIVSWNTLIAGYAEHMNGEEALRCLEEMHQEGMPPNDVTFIVTLKACCMLAAIDEGQEMHVEIAKGGLEKDPLVGKALVDMYWKCGSCAEALKVFHQLLFRDVFSWNQMITGYVEHGYDEEALTFMEQMQLEGVCPDPLTFVCSLKACGSLGALGMGQEMHLAIAKKGFEGEVFVANTLVHMYVYCGSLADAHELFDELLIQDTVSWDALIAVYAECGLGEEVLNCFDIMLLEGVPVSAFMLVCSLKACGNAGAIGRGHEIHAEVIKEAFERNTRVCNILVHMYAKCGLLGEARDVFDDMEFQDVVSWTALMAGCVEHGFGEEALICLEQMQVAGVSPNAFTFVCSLKACSSLGALGRGQEIHSEITNEGFETDHYVGSTLVDMYAKCGSLAEAQEVFEELAAGNVVSWNALITGYAEQGLSEGALDCLEQMLLEGVSPNAVTYVCILKACGSIGAIDKGRELHVEIAKEGYESDIYIGNTLVDMYAKSGLLVEALEMFDELLVKNIVSWTALIAGYSSQGQSEVVFSLFERMIKSGVRPDGITLLSVLSVCSHAGYVEKGLTYFNTFSQDNGIRLTLEHYNSMVDLLSRAGQLKESLSVIEKMPLKPNFVTWRTVLGACRKWGDVQLGRHAFECAMKVDETQTAACILMYNIYVDANMWEDARKIDALRANIQARKQLGIS